MRQNRSESESSPKHVNRNTNMNNHNKRTGRKGVSRRFEPEYSIRMTEQKCLVLVLLVHLWAAPLEPLTAMWRMPYL